MGGQNDFGQTENLRLRSTGRWFDPVRQAQTWRPSLASLAGLIQMEHQRAEAPGFVRQSQGKQTLNPSMPTSGRLPHITRRGRGAVSFASDVAVSSVSDVHSGYNIHAKRQPWNRWAPIYLGILNICSEFQLRWSASTVPIAVVEINHVPRCCNLTKDVHVTDAMFRVSMCPDDHRTGLRSR